MLAAAHRKGLRAVSIGTKSLTRTVEAQGDQMKDTFDGAAADGSRITGSGAPGADTIAMKQLNPSSYTSILKKAGQPVLTQDRPSLERRQDQYPKPNQRRRN